MREPYLVNRGKVRIESGQYSLDDTVWSDAAWQKAAVAPVDHFHSRSSNHRPVTTARLLCDGSALYLKFDVSDRFVVARATANQQSVCIDSCVEFFFRPHGGVGYFNFEFNCGGTVYASYVEDPTRTAEGLAKFAMLQSSEIEQLAIARSMPRIVNREIADPTSWRISCRIPLAILARYLDVETNSGTTWHGNFYKCADHSSHPHWASWSPIGEMLNFHDPSRFAPLLFA